MSLKTIASGATATAADLNALADDIPKTQVYLRTAPANVNGVTGDGNWNSFGGAYIRVLGDYLFTQCEFKITTGVTAQIRVVVSNSALGKQVVTLTPPSTTSTAMVKTEFLDALTALTSAVDPTFDMGDATGRTVYVELQGKAASGIVRVRNLKWASGQSSAIGDYLTW